ncbi:DUF3006 domain-containing protein [Deinococcus yavapaiensis]|uniref:DUF3006 family protein n=1 Tax=Deinococcus yavapaiensis KR-236 TaxID=694435 RepID=A0A318SBT3_9DEIO|nr:DUF3006 domain-containing protein [Deinococcus yavapaiensis]PYE48372.1 hypothetical protein DES52_13015 [Deinococcus yavapaiensis KR-236]
MPNFIVIDGFEADLARVEWEGRLLDLPRAWLPSQAQEGDYLRVHAHDGTVTFTLDVEASKRALSTNQAALNALNAADDGGDVQL